MSTDYDPYAKFDDALDKWALQNKVHLTKQDRNYPVRTFWVYDKTGKSKVQAWLDLTNESEITIHVAELDLDSPSKWGRKEVRSVSVSELIPQLDELKHIAFEWAGPDAFS